MTRTELSDSAWRSLLDMLTTLGDQIRAEARTPRERLEGYRVLAQTLALSTELSMDSDPGLPHFVEMTSPWRQIAGANPNGSYQLCMLVPGVAYRLTGCLGDASYLGLQVMAGIGMTPRTSALHLSHRDLTLAEDNTFSLVLSPEPPEEEQWIPIPKDASALIVRQYLTGAPGEAAAQCEIIRLGEAGRPVPPTDEQMAERLTMIAWTAHRLMMLPHTLVPEARTSPNEMFIVDAAGLGADSAAADNLYVLGMYALEPEQAMVLDVRPNGAGYWAVCVENIWHECADPFRTNSAGTHATFESSSDDEVSLVVSAADPGVPNWLDTGGRERGFVVLRWLDSPEPPSVAVRVVPLDEVAA